MDFQHQLHSNNSFIIPISGENCVHIAAQQNQIQILNLLIKDGADINARVGSNNYSPKLSNEIEWNNPQHVTHFKLEWISRKNIFILISKVQPVSRRRMTHSLYICREQFIRNVNEFHTRVKLFSWIMDVQSLLWWIKYKLQIRLRLTNLSFDALQEGRAGYTPLHIAVENNDLELATFLLANAKHLNTETLSYRQVTAYQLACELDYTGMIEILTNFWMRGHITARKRLRRFRWISWHWLGLNTRSLSPKNEKEHQTELCFPLISIIILFTNMKLFTHTQQQTTNNKYSLIVEPMPLGYSKWFYSKRYNKIF